jgi:hypothetical protein
LPLLAARKTAESLETVAATSSLPSLEGKAAASSQLTAESAFG